MLLPETAIHVTTQAIPVHHWQFTTRTYEMDRAGHLRLPVWQNYLEEAATQASAAFGFDYDWYITHRQIWVARTHTLQYHQALRYGEVVQLRTWISAARMVQAWREYEFRRVTDQVLVCRAQTQWAYVDMDTMRPTKIPDEIMATPVGAPFSDVTPLVFAPSQILPQATSQTLPKADDDAIPNATITTLYTASYTMTRRVLETEIDSAGHMNNSHYTAWAEAAIFDMFKGKVTATSMRRITYSRPALVDELIRLNCTATSQSDGAALITTRFVLDSTDELLCADQCLQAP